MFDRFNGGLLAFVFFILAFGVAILNPQYIDWLLESNKQDSIQHFVGWEFFRFEPWHFPLGLIQNYGHPISSSIIYTDSIPVLAFIFKCFAKVLPAQFQYMGLWYLLCFILQGTFAWKLCSTLTTNTLIKITITLFFLLSPIMLNCMIQQQALMAHWVILAGFTLYFQTPVKKTTPYYWLCLMLVTLLIHAYLVCMVFMIWIAFLCKQVVIQKEITLKHAGTLCVALIGVLAIIAWLSGYFIVPLSSLKTSFLSSTRSMDLIAPFAPTKGDLGSSGNWSRWIMVAYPFHFGQGIEGFNYFGVGMLLLILIGLVCFIKRPPTTAVRHGG